MGLLALVISVAYHLQVPLAGVVAVEALTSLLNREIQGELEVGELQNVTYEKLVARDVVLRDPEGRAVIVVERLAAWPDWGALLDGVIRIDRARARGGEVTLYVSGPEGDSVSLVDAFLPADPTPSQGPSRAPRVIVDNIVLDDIVVHGDVPEFANLRVEDIRIDGRIEAQTDVRFRVFDGRGVMTGPYEGRTPIDRIVGHFDTDMTEGLDVFARAHRGEDRVAARIQLTRESEEATPEMDLRARVMPLHFSTLADMEVIDPELDDVLQGALRGHVRLRGPTDDLRLSGDVGTAGGRVHVRAHLPSDGPQTFEAWTEDRLRIARLIDGAPETSVGGRARLTLEEEDPPGSGERVQRLHADVEPLRIDGFDVPAFVLDGVIGEEALEVERFDAELSGGGAHATGRVGFDGSLDLHVTAQVPQLASEPNVRRLAPDARGSVSADLDVRADPGAENVRFDGRVAVRDARYGSVRADTFDVRGHASGLGDGPAPHLRLEGEATGFEVGDLSLGEVDLSVDGGPGGYDVEVRARDAEAGTAVALTGRAQVTERQIALSAPTLSIDLGPGDPWTGHVDLRFRPGESVEVDPLMLSRDGERIVVDGTYRFRGPDDIDVQLEDVNLAQLRPLAPDELENLGGHVDGQLTIRGDIDRRPQGRLTATIRDGSFRGVEDVEGTVDLSLEGNQLDTNVQLALGELGEVSAEGPITISDAALRSPERIVEEASLDGLRVRATGLDLRVLGMLDLVEELPMMGRVSTDIELGGRLDRPDLRDAVFILEQIAPEGWDPMRAKIRLSMAEDRAWIRQAWVADAGGALASGEAELPFSLTDPPDSLGALWRQLNASTWSASVRLEQRRFDTWPRPLRELAPPGLVGSASITAEGDERGPRAQFAAVGRFVDGSEDGSCGTDARPLVTVRGQLEGELAEARFTGFLGGAEPALDAEAYATLPLGEWAERGGVEEFPSTELRATVRNADLGQVPFVCEHARGPLWASLTAKDLLTGRSVVGAVIDMPHLQIWETAGEEGQARLSTDYRVHIRAGSSPERDAITACSILSVADEASTAGAQCREVEEAAPGEMISRVRVPVAWTAGQLLPSYVEDGVITSWNDFAGVHVEPVLTLIPGVVAGDAVMDGEVEVRGPWGGMQLDGELAISEGHVQIEGLGQHLHDISGRVRLEGDRAVFPEDTPLIAHDSGGEARLYGSVDFQGIVPRGLDVTARAARFPIRREGMVLAWLSGGASVTGQILDERTTSTIRIRDFSVELPEQSAATLQSLEPHPEILVVGGERPEGREVVSESYPVAIHIDARDPFWVRRTDFSAQVTAELDAVYQDPDLRVSGEARILRGTFEIFGKRFELTEGRMFFDGSPEMDPSVNVTAVYEVPGRSGATVTVELTGTLTEPHIEFRSTETSDRAEIIALLLSGGRRETGTAEQQASEQAASFLAGLTAGILTLGLRREFGSVIPVLAIESQGVGGTRVRAGINADDLIPDFLRGFVLSAYIEGFVTAAAEGTNAAGSTSGSGGIGGGVTIELTLPESFLIRGTYVPVDNGSLDLFYEP